MQPKARQLSIKLSEAEHLALAEAARAQNMTLAGLCVGAVLAIVAMSRDEKPYAARGDGKNFERRRTLREHPELQPYQRYKGEEAA